LTLRAASCDKVVAGTMTAAQAAATAMMIGRFMFLLRVAEFLTSRRSMRRVAALQPHRLRLSSEWETVTSVRIQKMPAL